MTHLSRIARNTLTLALIASALAIRIVAAPDAPTPAAPAAATAPDQGRKVVAVGKIKVTPAVHAAAARKKLSLDRISQAFDSQLIDRLQSTGKYQVIARSDTDALIEEAGATLRAFDFGNADYLLIVTVDDFQDVVQEARFATLNKTAKKRVIRLSSVGKLYDAKTNKVIETANFQVENIDTEETLANISSDGDLSDSLLLGITREMSEKIAQRVVDIGFPARIVARTGKVVTINRGDGTGIVAGQLWEAFAIGEALIDPDTGANLGREEIPVGHVRVTRVNPKTSLGEISGEDLGITRGATLRRVEN